MKQSCQAAGYGHSGIPSHKHISGSGGCQFMEGYIPEVHISQWGHWQACEEHDVMDVTSSEHLALDATRFSSDATTPWGTLL